MRKIQPQTQTATKSATPPQWPGLKKLEHWRRTAAPPEYSAEALKTLQSAGKVTRIQYLERLYELDEKYPGRGWKEAIDELERFYDRHKLPLSDLPNRHEIG